MNILADTCFWISLCDPSERNHRETVAMMDFIRDKRVHSILVPHPVLYETLRTDMVKKPEQVISLTNYFNHVIKIPDEKYFNEAVSLVEQQAIMRKGTASMVDFVIRLMADDRRNDVRAILTRNGRDFSEFCRTKNIYMVENKAILEVL